LRKRCVWALKREKKGGDDRGAGAPKWNQLTGGSDNEKGEEKAQSGMRLLGKKGLPGGLVFAACQAKESIRFPSCDLDK